MRNGSQPPNSKLPTGWLSAARAARGASSDQPPACLPLCTALSLLARPPLERIRSVTEGDFASAYGTLAAGGLSVRGRNVGGQLADERTIGGLPSIRDLHGVWARVRGFACGRHVSHRTQ